jgi:hypothetical protein
MPLVWLGIGLLVMAAFAAVLWLRFGVSHPVADATSSTPPAKLSR